MVLVILPIIPLSECSSPSKIISMPTQMQALLFSMQLTPRKYCSFCQSQFPGVSCSAIQFLKKSCPLSQGKPAAASICLLWLALPPEATQVWADWSGNVLFLPAQKPGSGSDRMLLVVATTARLMNVCTIFFRRGDGQATIQEEIHCEFHEALWCPDCALLNLLFKLEKKI